MIRMIGLLERVLIWIVIKSEVGGRLLRLLASPEKMLGTKSNQVQRTDSKFTRG